ncbi:molybdopterin-dependent oxidoreductase [Mesorhizobium sp. B2-3-5]|uniref:molybdopterin-dependent oxidoreductase n=1 Tax=Mesorhizobium sp. B2-3-5 TaxID=2589958 RepID=UPI00112B60D9|nr:molybdopterin-dependent oxidoreductase [Mesorhizobium sp. B2-3-5]TPM19204.1 Asp-tRNA(Asn)/Glu-tRNA(Gln) amidotransferase GatCAB subunit C [Mesorhizobium sp. B2-3-5]
MRYTAAHWGAYQIGDNGLIAPINGDVAPSRIGRGWQSAASHKGTRIASPVVRKGWLDGDRGAGRSDDSFVEVSWDKAISLVGQELDRVRTRYGNGSIFGGSYGWSSAGRFHHAQGQMRRFLNLIGGSVSKKDAYSFAAAEVLLPRLTGFSNHILSEQMTSWSHVTENCTLLVAFGGISVHTAQVDSGGTSRHEVDEWLSNMANDKTKLVSVAPRQGDLPGAEWISIRPGTDTAMMLALSHELLANDLQDEAFLARYTSGWPQYRSYLLGEADGQAKHADWAAPICDIPADVIRALAKRMAAERTMISVSWALQRADHGEQPLWAGLALAAMLGQMAHPGLGFGFGYGSTTPIGRPMRDIPWPALPQGKNPVTDFIPVARITDMLLHPGETYTYDGKTRTYPDIRLIFWTGGNPFHHHQDLNRLDRAWRRPETIIVNEHSWTATARRADIVLPATTPLERHDIMLNRRDKTILYMSPAHRPYGQAMDDFQIFGRLARHFDVEEAFTLGRDTIGWLRAMWQDSRAVARDRGYELPEFDEFREKGRFDLPGSIPPTMFLGKFMADPQANPLATESGKITLFNQTIADMKLEDCPGHPVWRKPIESLIDAAEGEYHLISGQPQTRLHSQNDMGSEAQASKIKGREPCDMHPDTAATHGIEEGDVVRIYNQRGACLAGVRLDPRLRSDCILLATGAWFDLQIVNGQPLDVHGNPNTLTLDKGCSGLSQGTASHTTLVRIERWSGPVPELTVNRPPRITPLAR